MVHFKLAKFFSRLPTNLVHTEVIVTKRCHNHVLGTFSHKKKFLLKRLFFRANHLRESRKSFQKINLREKIFSFALSAKMFGAFDDDLLRDKLEFFLRQVSFIILSFQAQIF